MSEERPAEVVEDSGSGEAPTPGSLQITRRAFLRAAVGGGAAVAIGSLGYLLGGATASPRATPTASPVPSGSARAYPPGSRTYRTRPDLWSPPIVEAASPGPVAPGRIFLTPATGPGNLIVDDSGEPLWIGANPATQNINLEVTTYGGQPVLSWWDGKLVGGSGGGEFVLADRAYREVARIRGANGIQPDPHELIVTTQGSAIFTAYGAYGDWERAVLAPQFASGKPSGILDSLVQEVDIASGQVLFEWRASDHIAFDESYLPSKADQVYDYFHINSIYREDDGNLLISARHTCAVYRVNGRTGDVIWRLGGKRNDFRMGPGTEFSWQHDARRAPDGSVSLFDNASNGLGQETSSQSRGLVLDVDETNRTVTLRKAYTHPTPIAATSQGSLRFQSNGDALVGWGGQPWYTEFTADGQVVLDARMPDASFSYRAVRYEWRGRPQEPPAVVVERGQGAAAVYVSWNGATEVDSWTVLGGNGGGPLAPIAHRPRSGFETRIPVVGLPAVIALRALDAAGAVLVETGPINT
jgi:hypothetical protein